MKLHLKKIIYNNKLKNELIKIFFNYNARRKRNYNDIINEKNNDNLFPFFIKIINKKFNISFFIDFFKSKNLSFKFCYKFLNHV